jgi:hypothetical protein
MLIHDVDPTPQVLKKYSTGDQNVILYLLFRYKQDSGGSETCCLQKK